METEEVTFFELEFECGRSIFFLVFCFFAKCKFFEGLEISVFNVDNKMLGVKYKKCNILKSVYFFVFLCFRVQR